VSKKQKGPKLLLCLVLGFASLIGAPMRAEEIEDLLAQMNQVEIVAVAPVEKDEPAG